ncbi:ATP-binding cassette sub-family A member 3-like [Otolemur garnettii]|uniref:ATP-binding cassette sub-family A member 3-like n=1 Tax=Otolemur garnettii TaxID=30611 RepID=UPI000C7F4DC5|nr:ATP-binding cassette sub-family A member 3-like [Otolemur garnettii]
MDSSEFRKFIALLWKNFILKKRKCIALVVEMVLTFIFGATLLGTRYFTVLKTYGPYGFPPLRVDDVPLFIRAPTMFPYPWELAYVPSKSIVVRDIVENVKMNLNNNIKVLGFSTEGHFEDYVKQENNSQKVLAAIVFDHNFKNSNDPLPLKVKYYLRFSNFQKNILIGRIWDKKNWFTSFLFSPLPMVGPRNFEADGGSPGYISEGFLAVQHALDKAIMLYHSSTGAQKMFNDTSIFVQRFPYPSYRHDYFFSFVGILLPIVIECIFSLNHLILIQSIVWEKENRLKEYQLMIGLSNWMLWAAYFVTFLLLYSITIIFMCIIFFIKIKPVPIIQHSDSTLIFIFLLFYAISTICFSFVITTLFNKGDFAVALGQLIFFATFFLAIGLTFHTAQMNFTKKLAACLSSNFAMVLGVSLLVDAEIQEIGLKWSNIFSSTKLDDFFFVYVLGMLLFDALLYGLVTWYIEAVFPGSYGMPKPWNFFLLRSYWFGNPPEKRPEINQFYDAVLHDYFEAEPTDLVPGIQIQNLCKVFRVNNENKVAIKDLSLNLYEGQITVLLGHNGAGKSTTLSILSGLYPPTSGKAYINGYNISRQMVQIRKSLGLCPQHDLLFNYMTVSEHLYFYGVIKGIHQKAIPMEINNMLSAFKLLEKHNALSKSLSGGMKRKLSVIIALIGGSKVVILDEPTSGMDPASRRVTWDLLQQYKKDRTILLTTHLMDEADILGDRIAIMVRGSLRCCGSSVFLKKLYGVGYHIVMVKEPNCKVEEISKLIQYYTPSATLENNVGSELSFILPKEYAHRFEGLFTSLEEGQKTLGIASFGASVTTMEEVFLRVSHMEVSDNKVQAVQPSQRSKFSAKNQNRNVSRNATRSNSPILNESQTIRFNTGCSLYNQQFRAMFVKRVMFNWRNWKLVLLQILGLLGSFAFLLTANNIFRVDDARKMDLGQYGHTVVPFSVSGDPRLTMFLLHNFESIVKSENQRLKEVQGDLLNYLRKSKDCIHLCIIALSIEAKANETKLTVLFNNEAYHSPSVALALLDNVLFRSLSGSEASLTVSNKPQPRPDKKHSRKGITNGQEVAISLQFGTALLISGFSLLTVTERTSKAKHIQFVSGVSVFVYWLSALLWDFIIFFISCCLIMGVLKYFKFDIYVMDYHILETMVIFILYGWAAIPFVYLMSFLFSKSTSAYIILMLLNYFSGTIGFFIGTALENEIQTSMSDFTRNFLRNSLLLFPNYNLARCIAGYTTIYQEKILCISQKNPPLMLNCSKKNTEKNIYSLENNMIGKYLIIMSIMGFLCLFLIFLGETTLWRLRAFLNRYIYFGIYRQIKKDIVSKELSGKYEDEDIQNERKRVLEQTQELLNSTLIIKELIKIYFTCPVILAVKNISLAVQTGECFGLLGFNGAGKTTTFQILTGEDSTTSGDVIIDGFSITKNILKVRSRIGYCPQFDALLEYMTAWEIMIMYARLWGLSEDQIKPYVKKCLKSLELEPYADKLISTYSGGNKRKLSTVIAIMGKPSVIFLDEPSTGMDPVARRLLWDKVTQTRESGKTIIITSHSMEECDALCTNLAIMVQGKFMCLGSPQHLKSKFGNIYILKAKAKTKDKLEDFKMFIKITFPDSVLKHENQGILNYYIPRKDTGWGQVFGILEKAKEQFDLEDYSISQVTLEQVFLSFADTDNRK